MLAAFALLLAATDAVPAPPAPRNEIVVRGTSLQALKDELDRCIARACPVREDVIASVRYAEGLFRTGRYQDSRKVLQKAIERDRHGGPAEPQIVAALYEATASVARHDGEQEVVAKAVYDRTRLIKDTMPADSAEVLRAEMDEADIVLSRSGAPAGLARYRAVETKALAAGQRGVAAGTILRQAQVQAQAMHDPAAAARLLDGLLARAGGLPPGFRLAAYAMKARLPRRPGDPDPVEALRTALASQPQARPVLLFAPPLPGTADARGLDYYNFVDTVTRGGDYQGIRWADVGFSIRPDGTVEDAEPLRGNLGKDEVGQITANIGKRVYAALTPDAGGQYRVERWTLTADYDTPTKSLIRRRIVRPHYETLDVTTEGARDRQPAAAS